MQTIAHLKHEKYCVELAGPAMPAGTTNLEAGPCQDHAAEVLLKGQRGEWAYKTYKVGDSQIDAMTAQPDDEWFWDKSMKPFYEQRTKANGYIVTCKFTGHINQNKHGSQRYDLYQFFYNMKQGWDWSRSWSYKTDYDQGYPTYFQLPACSSCEINGDDKYHYEGVDFKMKCTTNQP